MRNAARSQIAAAVVIVLSLATVVFVYGLGQIIPRSSYQTIRFQTIAYGVSSCCYAGANISADMLINDDATWGKVQSTIYPVPPRVNFTSNSVIAVFQGVEPSTGYHADITRVILTDSELLVQTVLTVPGPGCAEASILTSPFHIVNIPKTRLQADFQTYWIIGICS